MKLAIRPLTPDLWPALEDLFGENGAVGVAGAWRRLHRRSRHPGTCPWATSPFPARPAREAAGIKERGADIPVLPLTCQMGPRVRIRFPPAGSRVRT
jgi:hypothetical protein